MTAGRIPRLNKRASFDYDDEGLDDDGGVLCGTQSSPDQPRFEN